MAVWFTADTHFGDARALRFNRRPFADAAAMDQAMVERWNALVAPDDTVWHLGDFASGRGLPAAADTLAALHGHKHLIRGNNDPDSVAALPGWRSVAAYAEVEADGVPLVLCHYPFRTWNDIGRGAWNLHGHSHGRLRPVTRQADVGVDVHDFRPIPLAELRRRRVRTRA